MLDVEARMLSFKVRLRLAVLSAILIRVRAGSNENQLQLNIVVNADVELLRQLFSFPSSPAEGGLLKGSINIHFKGVTHLSIHDELSSEGLSV